MEASTPSLSADAADDMWSAASIRATAALLAAVLAEIMGGVQMKRAEGFRNPRATLKAFAWTLLCVACTVALLSDLELSVGWSLYTALELGGVVGAGVLVWGEEMNGRKVAGLLAASSGVILLELSGGDMHAWGARGARRSAAVAVNLPLVLAALVLATVCAILERRWHGVAACSAEGALRAEELSEELVGRPEAMHDTGAAEGRRRPACFYGYLVLATACEVADAVCMKEAEGFRKPLYTASSFALACVNVCLTIRLLAQVSLSIVWALYTACEYTSVLAIGVFCFGDSVGPFRMFALMLTAFGVMLLIIEEEGLFEDSESESDTD